MRPLIVCAIMLVAACASTTGRPTSPAQAPLIVGVSEVDITPEEPIRLTGYSNRVAPSEGIGQRLWAKALAFGDGRQAGVLMTVDLIGVSRALTDEVGRRLEKRGIRRAQLAIAATHTHTGPSLAGVLPFILSAPPPPDQQMVIERYTHQLTKKLEHVAEMALSDRRPSTVAWGQGRAGFAANRRVLKDGRWVGFGINPAGSIDHDLPILAVRALDGRLRAVLVSYACHATTLEGKNNVIHGDWPGTAKELIQQRHPGAIALIALGAGADANPNPRGGGLPDVERNAREIADEVDRLLTTPLRPILGAPLGRLRWIDLTFATVPTRAELEEQARHTGSERLFARSMIQRLDRGESIPRTVPYPIQTWTFGDALTVVFLGGEVVADYGLRLKRELDATRLWVNAYSNDVAFYVASKRMIPEGGYEVDRSMIFYGQPGPLAEETEDQIIQAVKELAPAARKPAK